MSDKPITVAALAERWGCSDTFIYGLLTSGQLEGFKLGKKLWRISPEAVERFERGQSAQPQAEEAPADKPDTDVNAARIARQIRLST